jgi:hypothetical protein
MSKQEKPTKLTHRDNPPVLPSGFRFGISESICVVDFIDAPDDNVAKVFYSIAITKNQAQELIEIFSQFVSSPEK